MKSAGAKVRHASKKNKASWRKNVDISDVEGFLEEQREHERLAGNVADRTDAELFVEETRPQKAGQRSRRELRRQQFEGKPKFCAALENTSKVSDPVRKRNVITNKEKLLAIGKRKSKVETVSVGVVKRKAAKQKQVVTKDLWADEDTSKKTVRARPNAVSNVELPPAGASYNPAIDDYNELKQAVVETEKKNIKRAQHLDRVVTAKFGKKLTPEQREKQLFEEMSEGLFDKANKNEPANEDVEEEDYKAINPPVQNKKKTRAQQNKKFREVAKRNSAVALKEELKKLADINRLPEMNAKLVKNEKNIEVKRGRRAVRDEEKKQLPGRVAYLQFEAPEPDFVEPTELTDKLRTVAPNKSLIVDRFKSLQKRGLIAPKKHRDGILRTNRSTLKKWKRYTLNSHKEEGVSA
uniref:Ribosome biogenesis protein NOP53 n=1 Tax=Culex tarsalis TaxID=7177 RepID=A0A1Q3EWQ3_CULTA